MSILGIHGFIGAILDLIFVTATVIAFLAVVITGYLYYTEGPGAIPDEVWDLYTKGGKYNYEHMGDSGNSSAPRAYSDPRGRHSNISGNYDPETWQAVEYDDDGDFGRVAGDGPDQVEHSEIELDVTNELDQHPI